MSMIKRFIFGAVLFMAAAASFAEDPPTDAYLVYPSAASVAEALDSSSPYKRAVPPVAEDSEVDVVTPLGQVQGVLQKLTDIGRKQDGISTAVDKLTTDSKTAKDDRIQIATKIASIAAAPARSKMCDLLIIVTCSLVVLQTLILCGKTIVEFISSRRQKLEEQIAQRYIEKMNQDKKGTSTR